MFITKFILVLILTIATMFASASSNNDDHLVCNVHVRVANMRGHVSQEQITYMCETLPEQDPSQRRGMMYPLALSEDFVDQHPELREGNVMVNIPSGKVANNSTIEYDANAQIGIVEPSDRRNLRSDFAFTLPAKKGINSVLVVRVTSSDSEASLSSEQMSSRVFGIGGTAPQANLVTQHKACSFGKLQMEPHEGPDVVNGVVEMFLPRNTTQEPLDAYQNDLIDLSQQYDHVDHIMFCLPKGANIDGESFVAVAFQYGSASFYNDVECGQLATYMHELGHNLGLHHSGDRTEYGHEYGDTSGYMGFGSPGVGSPVTCYNAFNYWYLGWYDEDRTVEVSGDRPWSGHLDAFTNHDNPSASDSVVAIKVGDYYLQYNRADKFNFETRRSANQITVVEAVGYGRTDLEASLITGSDVNYPVFTIANFGDSGHTMIIEACEYEVESDRFTMSVHLEDGVQVSYCNGGVQPNPSPQQSPSFMRGGSADSSEGLDSLLVVAIFGCGFVLYLGFCLLKGKGPEEDVVDC